MTKRVNVTTWRDGCTITRKIGQLQDELMKYQPYALMDESSGEFGRGCLGGDSGVIVAAIELRDRVSQLIERSSDANKRL